MYWPVKLRYRKTTPPLGALVLGVVRVSTAIAKSLRPTANEVAVEPLK
jgi:hypothetical protein